MVKSVDTRDLKSLAAMRTGSSPVAGTKKADTRTGYLLSWYRGGLESIKMGQSGGLSGLFDLNKKYGDYTPQERNLLLFGSRERPSRRNTSENPLSSADPAS